MGDVSWTPDIREEREVFFSKKREPQDRDCRAEKDREYPPNSCQEASHASDYQWMMKLTVPPRRM